MITLTEVSQTVESINGSSMAPEIKARLLDKTSYLMSSLNSSCGQSEQELCSLVRHYNTIKSALHSHGVPV